ncbi:iron-sulfur cluster assembly scaffold protein [Zooshikella marina]|uniref:iron-sulfur cluster assembly scaffold protein n=1 Tax=Zooshikella ganghwensis TaxID=202772 RepID=UPI001BAF9762|nr:iron-sulfur cluster assembly scaffold protein [Zooshikella ganghwensis]MBU2705968.1 iron-sulfur cluster assembly scaffold protein [Zooshikella ganghwensis]
MFNEIIVTNFSAPTHQGTVESPDIKLSLGNPVCGDKVEITACCDQQKITQIRFKAWGCATSLAMANIFCRQVEGLTITEALKLADNHVDTMLGEIEPSQHHCLDMLKSLFNQLKAEEIVQ